jgi:hypothetical protein
MMTRLSRRDRRVLTVGVAVISITLGAARGLPLRREWVNSARDREWRAEVRRERLRAAVKARTELADSLSSATRRYIGLAPRLLDGDGAATTGAALLAIVSDAAERSGLQVGSIQSTGDSAGQRFVRVAVRGEATGDVIGLTGFLGALEGGQALAGIRELAVDQPEPAAPNGRAESLRIQFVVEGIGLRRVRRR